MKKKLSIFLLITTLVCGIFSFSNNSYAVTQEKELNDVFHSREVQPLTVLDSQGVSYCNYGRIFTDTFWITYL